MHNYSVYALQLTTVHYHTCRVFTLYLHWLPVFQYRRVRSPATLQLFSEDCCSARTLTRNSCNCNSLLSCQLTLGWFCHQLYSRGTDPIENAAFPLLRSRLGSDHIENMSHVVCLATVINNVSTVDCWPTVCMSQYWELLNRFLWIWGSHSSGYIEYYLLGYNAV
jgi:hypothetical protein